MSSIYYKTSDSVTPLVEIQPLESNGPGNLSTPRQIVDVEFLDKSFVVPTDAFVVNDDVTTRFITGFAFNIIGGSAYDGSYVVAAPGSVLVGGQTHIPVANIVDAANPTVYDFNATPSSAQVSPVGNSIATFGTLTGGTLYTTGTYNDVPLTGGSGTGARATIIVASGAVTSAVITHGGMGYTVGDELTASASYIGGTGSGFKVLVSSITPAVPNEWFLTWEIEGNVSSIATIGPIVPGSGYTNGTYSNVALNGGTGYGAKATITITSGGISAVNITSGGVGYSPADILTASTITVGGTGSGFSVSVATVNASAISDQIQIKHFLYTPGTPLINRVFSVVSATYDGISFTRVVTAFTALSAPVMGVNSASVVVSPVTSTVLNNHSFGYTSYTLTSASATSLRLVGKGSVMYNNDTTWGEAVQNNMIQLLENFAHIAAPVSPLDGQLWFDTNVTGPALQLRSGVDWYGIVAEGLPVQGNINMNDFKIANIANPATTYPYVASTTGWGNNDQEVMNLGTSDGLYIAKTGGYDANPAVRSGTMTGSLNMTGTAGINFKTAGSGSLTFEATTSGNIDMLGSGGINVTIGDIVLGTGTNTIAIRNNGAAAGTIVFSTVGVVPATGNNVVDLGNNMLTGLSNAVNPTDAVSLQYANGAYVNVTGDTMSGTLAMSGSANITLADGDIILGTGNNTVSVLRNGAAAGSIVFNTASASTTTGNNVIDLGGNMLTGLSNAVNLTDAVSLQYADARYINVTGDTMTGALILNADPSTALGAATKQYVDMFVSGIIWISPVLDQSLFADDVTAPPADDGFLAYHKSFIVPTGATGAWSTLVGRLVYWDGAAWVDILNRAVAIGDRFGVFVEPDNDDPLVNLPSGGLTGHIGKIATVTGVSPYTYSFYTPAEPDAFTVVATDDPLAAQSPHFGHSYTFRGTYGSGVYGTGYEWIEFLGPQTLIDGAGLAYAGQTLNVDGNVLSLYNLASNGMIARVNATTMAARTITGTTSNITVTNGDGVANNPVIDLAPVTQGAVGTSFVKVALDGFGRVTNNLAVGSADITTALGYTPVDVAGDTMTGDLILNADPTVALGAVTKQYADVSRVMALAATVNGTIPASAKVLLAITAQPFTIASTPSATPSYGYADVTSTGAASFDIQKNGVSVGSMNFAAGVNVATFTFASPVSFVAGDRIAVVAPGTPDATLADVYFTLRGTLV